jgi:hypothetical protein
MWGILLWKTTESVECGKETDPVYTYPARAPLIENLGMA